jgi:hypothetical protein
VKNTATTTLIRTDRADSANPLYHRERCLTQLTKSLLAHSRVMHSRTLVR